MPRFSFNARALVSLLLASSMLIVLASGFVLFASPQGRIAHDIGWTFLGMDKGVWANLHIAFGFLVLPVALCHLAFNWQALASYCRRKSVFRAMLGKDAGFKPEPVIALIVVVLIFLASYYNYPPVSNLRNLQSFFRTF